MNESEWTYIIKPRSKWWNLNLKSIWDARDLLKMFVWRDFVSLYKQTVLGPLWFFLQPLISTIVFTIIFGRIAKIPTDGLPQALFYMCGITCWGYFSDSMTKTANTFSSNAGIFGKVYFPRLIVPLSIIVSNIGKFFIQFCLFIGFCIYYYVHGAKFQPNIYILITPLLLLMMAGLGLGIGIIISSLTTKYRDLHYLIGFGTQLFMYVTPIAYPLSFISGKYKWIFIINPMTPIVETFKFAYLGVGEFNWLHLLYSGGLMLLLLSIAILVFNSVEKTFIDTV